MQWQCNGSKSELAKWDMLCNGSFDYYGNFRLYIFFFHKITPNMESYFYYLDFKLQLTNPIESENSKEGMFRESLCTKQQVIGSWSLTTSKFKKTIASR